MSESKATRSIIDTHRHIFGPKLKQKFVENIGFDGKKPMPQADAGEVFFYRESVDVDYSMEIQQKSGVTLCLNSYGGEIKTFDNGIVKASTIDTLKFLQDESFELRARSPKDIACMANAHALEENTRDVIDHKVVPGIRAQPREFGNKLYCGRMLRRPGTSKNTVSAPLPPPQRGVTIDRQSMVKYL